MLEISSLPTVNALLNSVSGVFLIVGYVWIQKGQKDRHRICMLGATLTSVLFLSSYLVYHYHSGSRAFTGTGWVRTVYFAILISHTIMAAGIVPLVIITLRLALKGRFERHRQLARWTLPFWLYVSATGVAVYWLLYRM